MCFRNKKKLPGPYSKQLGNTVKHRIHMALWLQCNIQCCSHTFCNRGIFFSVQFTNFAMFGYWCCDTSSQGHLMHVLLANYDNHIPWLLESSRRVWPKYICLCNVMLFSYFWYLLFCVFTSLYFHGRGCQPMQSTLSVVVWTVVEVGDIRIIFAKTLMNHLFKS